MAQILRITTRTFDSVDKPAGLQSEEWDIAFIGGLDSPEVDARSAAATMFARTHSTTQKSAYFNADENNFYIGETPMTQGALKTLLSGRRTMLIEATTLSCPEMLYLLRAAKGVGISKVSFLYLEPESYLRTHHNALTESRDFDLSVNRRFRPVSGFVADINATQPGQAVFFLGYEKARLAQALEQQEGLQSWGKHAVFGVPAFAAGWESDSFANNVSTIDGKKFNILYAGAACVEAAYKLLVKLKTSDKTESAMIISPLGTKPHAIATSLFLVENNSYDSASLLYDHPERLSGRSRDIRRWHLFDVVYQ